MRGEFITH